MDLDKTPPSGIVIGDRVALENRLDKMEAVMQAHMRDRDRMAHEFYQTRMIPLEIAVANNMRLIWFQIGMVVIAVLLSIVAIVIVALR